MNDLEFLIRKPTELRSGIGSMVLRKRPFPLPILQKPPTGLSPVRDVDPLGDLDVG